MGLSNDASGTSDKCAYVFRGRDYVKGAGRRCKEPPEFNGKCILHVDFPKKKLNNKVVIDETHSDYNYLVDKKTTRVKEKLKLGDGCFEGAILPTIECRP